MAEKSKSILLSCPLFKGFTLPEIDFFLKACPPSIKNYKSEENIIVAGFENKSIGIVLCGRTLALKEGKNGESFVVARHAAGGVVGDVLCGGQNKSPITLRAAGPCRLLFLYYPALLATGSQNMPENLLRMFLANLLEVVAGKYFLLHKRIDILLMKTIRQKVAAYLLANLGQGCSTVLIPYSQSNWAAHLGCERSALSRELSRMAADGILKHEKRVVSILDTAKLQQFA